MGCTRYSPALLQLQLGRRDGGPALNLAGSVDVGLNLLLIADRIGSVEQSVDLSLEFSVGLDLEHALVAHGHVTARISLELGAVHRHGALLERVALARHLNEQGKALLQV